MPKTTTNPNSVDPAARIRYPSWCDRSRTRAHDSGDANHFRELRRWKAAQDDVIVQLDLTRIDEYVEADQLTFEGDTLVRLGLTSTAYCMTDAHGDEVAMQLDTDLDAADCRKLAAHLLAAADRLEDLAGAR